MGCMSGAAARTGGYKNIEDKKIVINGKVNGLQ